MVDDKYDFTPEQQETIREVAAALDNAGIPCSYDKLAPLVARFAEQAKWDAICAKHGHEWYIDQRGDKPKGLYCRQCGKRQDLPR